MFTCTILYYNFLQPYHYFALTNNNDWPTIEAFAEALERPEQVNLEALKAERQAQEARATRQTVPASQDNPLGLPLWQVGLLLLVIFAAIIAFGIIAQLVHH